MLRRAAGWSLVAFGALAAFAAAFLLVLTVRNADPGCWSGAPTCQGLGRDLFDAGWQLGLGAAVVGVACFGAAWLLLRARAPPAPGG